MLRVSCAPRCFNDPGFQLRKERVKAAKANLDKDLARESALRKISLQRLEAAIAKRKQAGLAPTSDMLYLAGLTRITHVFFYPETGDIVIAGPAQGYFEDISGRTVGLSDGSAVMRLDDLIVALRSFAPNGKQTGVIGCSIDPTQEGLANFQSTYLSLQRQFRQPRAGMEAEIAHSLKNALGLQMVTVQGVSPKTHFAQVLVEADYRMKLIGIGLEQPSVRINSFVDNVTPSSIASNALQRWYFTPDYECIRVTRDENAMSLQGNGAKLIGEDERVAANGARTQAARANRASKGFTTSFTKKFNLLADETPVFAELRNLMDLSIAAAFIQEMDFYGQAEWEMPLLGDEAQFAVESYAAPKTVEPALNAIWKKRMLMTPIGGGVMIQARKALEVDNMKYDDAGEIEKTRDNIQVELNEGQWWWD